MTDDSYERARKSVKKKKGFYKHLAAYLIINTFILINNGFEFGPWLPWGVGLAFHYISVFGFPGSGILSKEWEDKELEKEMRGKEGDYPRQLDSGGEPMPDFSKKEDPELDKKLDEIPRNWSDKDLV